MPNEVLPLEALIDEDDIPFLKERALDHIKSVLAESVVCIRGTGMYRFPAISRLQLGKRQHAEGEAAIEPRTIPFEERPAISKYHGSGIVIGTEQVGDRTEHLVLTNNHVGTVDLIFPSVMINGDGDTISVHNRVLVEKNLKIVQDMYDHREGRTNLEFIASAPDNDAALLRTTGVTEPLHPFPYRLGLDEELVRVGASIQTAGFPGGEHLVVADGQIISTSAVDLNTTPYPNRHYLVTIPIDAGQSGSPVVTPIVAERGGSKVVEICLIGLVYAKASDTDTVRMVTPYTGFSEMVRTQKSIPSKRPSLFAKVDPKEFIAQLRAMRPQRGHGDANTEYVFMHRGDQWQMHEYRKNGPLIINAHHLEWHFRFNSGLHATRVRHISDEGTKELDLTTDPPFADWANSYLTAQINQFMLHKNLQDCIATSSDADESRMFNYLASVANSNLQLLQEERQLLAMHLYQRNLLPRKFFF